MTDLVQYGVSMPDPHSHLFEVNALLPTDGAAVVEATLPTWTPGSYLIREFARHIQELRAADEKGRPLSVERRDKRTWAVRAEGASTIKLSYRVYANELTVRTSHLDSSHAYFNGACLFLSSEPLRKRPIRLTVDAPAAWSTFTSLREEGGAFFAADYDELIDSPVEVGPQKPLELTVAGVPHRLVIWGRGNLDEAALARDLARICEAEARMFGGLPLDRYTFLLLLSDKGRGGLEHMNSSTLLYPHFAFKPEKSYEDFLTLAAHEYFHLWNVKRISPRAFVPFDYGQENYTRLLWAFEGFTSYYDELIVRRVGLMSAKHYLERLGEVITTVQSNPSRHVQSLADASFCAWIKYYRPDESSVNSAVSYYLKGEIVGLLLDLTIRASSAGKRSLDDVMRLLFQRYGRGEGVPEDGVEACAEEVAGSSLRDFFASAVHGTGELDFSVLRQVGLELKSRPKEGAQDKGGTPGSDSGRSRPHLGINTRVQGDRLFVASVPAGTPAASAGLYPEDELLALDGFRVEPSSFSSRLDERKPGDTVRMTVFRRDEIGEIPITLGTRPADTFFFDRVAKPSPEQKAAYEAWLGEPWDAPSGRGPG